MPFQYQYDHQNASNRTWITSFGRDGKRMAIHTSTFKVYDHFFDDPDKASDTTVLAGGFRRIRKACKYGLVNAGGDLLTKNGKKVQQDNLYIFDNAPDCESGGFIRFRDHTTGKAGMLNRKGEVVIPAEYDDLSRVGNGLMIALKDHQQHRRYPLQETHFPEGESMLIDTTHQILIRNFPLNASPDFYSIGKSTLPDPDSNRISLQAANGGYYSFLDYKKNFQNWLIEEVLPQISVHQLSSSSFDSLQTDLGKGWEKRGKNLFIKEHYAAIKSNLERLKKEDGNCFVVINDVYPFSFREKEYKTYFNNCGEPLKWKFPLMDLVVTQSSGIQNHFEFLRTHTGYKLASVTLKINNKN